MSASALTFNTLPLKTVEDWMNRISNKEESFDDKTLVELKQFIQVEHALAESTAIKAPMSVYMHQSMEVVDTLNKAALARFPNLWVNPWDQKFLREQENSCKYMCCADCMEECTSSEMDGFCCKKCASARADMEAKEPTFKLVIENNELYLRPVQSVPKVREHQSVQSTLSEPNTPEPSVQSESISKQESSQDESSQEDKSTELLVELMNCWRLPTLETVEDAVKHLEENEAKDVVFTTLVKFQQYIGDVVTDAQKLMQTLEKAIRKQNPALLTNPLNQLFKNDVDLLLFLLTDEQKIDFSKDVNLFGLLTVDERNKFIKEWNDMTRLFVNSPVNSVENSVETSPYTIADYQVLYWRYSDLLNEFVNKVASHTPIQRIKSARGKMSYNNTIAAKFVDGFWPLC